MLLFWMVAVTWWHMKTLLPQLWGTQVQRASPAATQWTEPVRTHDTFNSSSSHLHDHVSLNSSLCFGHLRPALIKYPTKCVLSYSAKKYSIMKQTHTFHSNPPTAMPAAAPVPAKPTKWPLPILLANRDAPTCEQQRYAWSLSLGRI